MNTLELGPQPTAEWQQSLQLIPRFSKMEMTHRTYVYTHAYRARDIAFLLADRLDASKQISLDQPIDRNKFRRFIHHDDPEFVTTDIPSNEKRAMNPEQREKLRRQEEEAAQTLGPKFTTLPMEIYLADQIEIHKKETTESQIFDVADKLDGLCAAIHEFRAGIGDEYLRVIENYRRIFQEFKKYPFFKALKIAIPSKDTLARLVKVDKKLLIEGRDREFWNAVYDKNLPDYYKDWMNIASGKGMFRTLSSAISLFPGWKDELKELWKHQTGVESSDGEISLEELALGGISF